MLDGLEAVELRLSEVLEDNDTKRIDSEYFKKEYLSIFKKISTKQDFFKTFAEMDIRVDASAFYPSLEPFYNQGDIPFLRVADVNTQIDYEGCVKIPQAVLDDPSFNTLKVIKQGDIVVTKGGSIARIGLINQNTAVTRDLIFLNSSSLNSIDYKFLFLYLLTNISYNLLIRSSSMTAQPHLTIGLVKNLPIFNPNNSFKKKIVDIFDLSDKKLEDSKILYKEAEELLLEELDLLNFKPSNENISIKSFKDSFGNSGRLDSEYYQPKYDEIIEKIKSYKGGFEFLKTACILKDTNYSPKDKEYYKYIELSNIGNNGNITDFIYELGQDLPSRARRKIKTNDVIVSSIEGSIDKIALVAKEFDNALCSTGFYVLNSKKINSETLLVLFKNRAFQQILKQNCSGTILTAINKDEFLNIIIPIIEIPTQTKIEEKIKKSFELKENSKQLLDLAKRAVELAIEKNEDEAMNFIEEALNEYR